MASRKPVIHGRDHLIGGADPIPLQTQLSSNTGNLLDQIIGKSPNGFWKLNESSGTVAHDSSGNGYDMATAGGKAAPTWGQPAGPPGELCAGWLPSSNQGVELTTYPYLSTGDFTAVGWAYYNDTDTADIYAMIGQGNGAVSFGQGWGLGIGGSSTGYPKKLVAWFGHGTSGPFTIVGNNALTAATWYMFALVQSSGSQYIYVNGLQQTATGTFTYTNHLGIWLGNDFDVSSAAERMSGRMSYWATFNRALSGTELLAMYNTGTTGGNIPAGEVVITDGSGGTTFGAVTESMISLSDVTTDNVTSSKHGLAPKSPADATQFLNGATTPAYAQVKDSDLSTSDITTNNVSISKHGFAPKAPNDATKYLDGTGAYTVPPGGTPSGTAGGDLSGTYPNPSLKNTGPGVTGPIGGASTAPVITIDAQGRVTALTSAAITGASGYTTVQDEGTGLTARAIIDFAGAGVTATDDAANSRTLVTIPGASGGSVDIQSFTATGTSTWTMPAGVNQVRVICLGAGGGGGGGGASVSTARNGGAGGGGGAATVAIFDATDLTSTVTVTVGTGGTHGNGASAGANADGTAGSNGGHSSFGSYLRAGGGGGGNPSSNLVNSVGGGGGGVYGDAALGTPGTPGVAGTSTAAGNASGGAGAGMMSGGSLTAGCAEYGGASGGGDAGGTTHSAGGSSIFGGAGGGCGGGVTGANVGANGGDGGISGNYTAGGGGAHGNGGSSPTGGTGGAAPANNSPPFAGTGGGGGGAGSAGHAGQAGGKGGTGCGGGGGGCGSNTGGSANAGGNGGDGGDGKVIVVSW